MPPLHLSFVVYVDNRPCVEQISTRYMKGDKSKHIALKLFFAKEQQGKDIDIQ
jgi:hypothetical protein